MATSKSTKSTTRRGTPTPRRQPAKPLTVGQRFEHFWAAYKRNQIARFFSLWLASYLILLSSLLVNVLKDHNDIEIFPRELVFPMVMHAATALLVALSLFWMKWLRSFASLLIAVTVLSLNLVGYDGDLQNVSGVIKAFVPGLISTDSQPVTSVVFLILLLATAVGVGALYERVRRRRDWLKPQNIQLAVSVLIVWFFAVPAFSVAQLMPSLFAESNVNVPALPKPAGLQAPTDKPDIYYFVFDRYTSNDVLKSQFNFDNSGLMDFFRGNGYAVNEQAQSNYPYTASSIASTLNADYLNKAVQPFVNTEPQSRIVYHQFSQKSAVARALKDAGYRYEVIGNWYATSNYAPLADEDLMSESKLNVLGTSKELHGIESSEFVQSIYYRFAKIDDSWWPFKIEEKTEADSVIAELNTFESLSQEKPGGRFIFVHILLPHEPQSFNADGSFAAFTGADNFGKPAKDKYVGSVQFANTQITKIVNQIKTTSGDNAVVIFNSDEGPYPEYYNSTIFKPALGSTNDQNEAVGESTDTWPLDWFHMKYGILQAVHIPKATTDDIAHLNSANIFRIVLNRYLDYSLPYLPTCHFGLPKSSLDEYILNDVTGKFTSTPDPACKNYTTVQ